MRTDLTSKQLCCLTSQLLHRMKVKIDYLSARVHPMVKKTRAIFRLSATLLLAASFGLLSLPTNAEPVLEGTVCSERVHELTSDIHWYNNLNEAEAQAKEQGKLVFWMHMLGKIDGAT
jgi:hypothetical protein